LHLDSDEGRAIGSYLQRVTAEADLGSCVRFEGGLELGGYRALDITPVTAP
jgi:hypothetical protein